jgi:hypothetical protein
MKKWFYIFGFVLWTGVGWTQVNFKTRVSKTKLSTNDRLQVRFEISTKGESIDKQSFTAPTFDGFQRIMGPSTSQEWSFINGRQSAKFSYIYILQPVKTGQLTIGKASVKIDDKIYETQPVTVEVVKGENNPNANQRNYPAPQNNGKTDNITLKDKVQGAFLVADVSKSKPYVNEAVGLTYKLYIPKNYGVTNYNETEQPQYNGFWVQDINKNISGPYQGEINGKPYIYYVLRKKVLFPQHSGKLTIKPLTLQIDVQVPVYRNFFGMRVPDYEIQRVKLTSGKKILQVKELPKDGQPIDFSGAVGQFDFKVTTAQNQIKSGEPVSINVSVKGNGNLKLFDLPKLKAPDGLEVYDPKHTEHIQATFNGNKGTVQDEYIIVPDNGGKYIIPSMRFVYFDPKTKTYVTKTSDDIVLFVTGGKISSNNTIVNNNNNDTYHAADFRFIKEKTQLTGKTTEHFYGSKLFNYLISFPFVLAILAFGYYKYKSNIVVDETMEKRKKNKSLAAKYLKEAQKSLGDKETFYAHLEKALYNFIKAQLHIDTAEINREKIKSKLVEKNVSQDKINMFTDLLNRCDMARYAPATTTGMEKDYRDAENLMNSLMK